MAGEEGDAVRSALLADDSKVFRACTRELLQDRGFEVIEADSGDKALQLARAHRPELLVLDALMPLLSGFNVLEQLREALPDYRPVVFLVTALYKSNRWASEARKEYGVHEYLEKPVEDETLLAALDRHFPREMGA